MANSIARAVSMIQGFESAVVKLRTEHRVHVELPYAFTGCSAIQATTDRGNGDCSTQAVTFDGPTPMMMLQVGDNEREMTYVPSDERLGLAWVFSLSRSVAR